MHWLERLLNPKSIALIGASAKPGSIGNNTLRFLLQAGYGGVIYPVNPRYQYIEGVQCFNRLAELPAAPDLAMIALGGLAVEQALDEAIGLGVGGAVIYANNYVAGEAAPSLLERLRKKAKLANIPVCGGNGMGYQNHDGRILASFDWPTVRPPGHVTLIAHSGSVMTYLANNDPRFTYNLAVSCGQEINATFSDYMDYALEQPSTRVIALFIEAVRDPQGFLKALEKAQQKKIPVVIAKVGRTEKSADFAKSHSGALAGNDQAFQAACHRYGAIRVRDLDELANTAYLLARVGVVPAGDLASVTDSGGLREQLIDLADDIGVAFSSISSVTKQRLAATLEYGLQPDNPLDAMGSLNADVGSVFEASLTALLDDPGTAVLSCEFEFRDDLCHYPVLLDVCKRVSSRATKPFMVINSFTRASNSAKAVELSHAGIPVINGADLALKAIKHAFAYRDFIRRDWQQPAKPDVHTVCFWQQKLASARTVDESTALGMLSDFGIPVVRHRITAALQSTLEAADHFGFPVVLKSAQPGLMHKTDVGGVRLDLRSRIEVETAFGELSAGLGSRVMVAPMINDGVEVAFGMVRDPQFGPVIMVGAGGINVELLGDHRFALAPVAEDQALALLKQLMVTRLMTGVRNRPVFDLRQLALTFSRFSTMVSALKDQVQQMDINPVIVHPKGCIVVDALIVPSHFAN